MTAYVYNLKKFWHDFEFVIFSSLVTGPGISAIYRMFNWTYKHKLVYKMYMKFITFDQKYPNHSTQLKIVKKYNVFLNTVIVIIVTLLIMVKVALLCTPLILYAIFNLPRELPMAIVLIEVDWKTTSGFIANYIYQILIIFVCSGIFMFVQPLNIMFTGLVSCMIEILRSRVKEFERTSLMTGRRSNHLKMKADFKQLIDDHNEIFKVAEVVEEILSFQLFLDITVFSVMVCIALFYARYLGWAPGYVLSLLTVFAGFINHYLGELTSIQLEKLSFDVYNVSWYRMSIPMQKSWLIFVQKAQPIKLFSCAGLKPVGIDTFSAFCNSIYSYFLLLNDLMKTK